MPLIDFTLLTPKPTPRKGVIKYDTIRGPDLALTMPKAPAPLPVTEKVPITPAVTKPLVGQGWRRQASESPVPVLEAMDKFNHLVQGLPLHSEGVANEGGRNTYVDFIGSLATVAFGIYEVKSLLGALGSAIAYIRTPRSTPDTATTTLFPSFDTPAEAQRYVHGLQMKDPATADKYREQLVTVLQQTLEKGAGKGDTDAALRKTAEGLYDLLMTGGRITPQTIQDTAQAVTTLQQAAGNQATSLATIQGAVQTLQKGGLLPQLTAAVSGRTIPMGGAVGKGKTIAIPPARPTIDFDKVAVSTAKHALMSNPPETVLDTTVVTPVVKGLVDITDRVDMPAVRAKWKNADRVYLDPKRKAILFKAGDVALDAMAIDTRHGKLMEWFGIDGNRILDTLKSGGKLEISNQGTSVSTSPAANVQGGAKIGVSPQKAEEVPPPAPQTSPLRVEETPQGAEETTLAQSSAVPPVKWGEWVSETVSIPASYGNPIETPVTYRMSAKKEPFLRYMNGQWNEEFGYRVELKDDPHVYHLSESRTNSWAHSYLIEEQTGMSAGPADDKTIKTARKIAIAKAQRAIGAKGQEEYEAILQEALQKQRENGLQRPATAAPSEPLDRVLAQREGKARLDVLNPVHWVNEIIRHDPLKLVFDKLGLYTMLYGKEEMDAIRAGRGNASILNTRLVPTWVKRNFLWAHGLSYTTQDIIRGVRRYARQMYGTLSALAERTAQLSRPEFVDMLTAVASGGSPLATQGQALNPAQELAVEWVNFGIKAADDLISKGQLDPKIFGRLKGHYLPAPYDSMGSKLKTLEDMEHIRPSLKFLNKQNMTPAEIIQFASQEEHWQDYRDFFVQRMRAEVRAAEKGGVFNAVAYDPKAGVVDADTAPRGYITVADEKTLNAFGLAGKAIPPWVALFLRNEFMDAQVARQMQTYSELLSWYKFFKVGTNIPTLMRNIVSQLTVQTIEGGVSPLDIEHYFVRPLAALLGIDKKGKEELRSMGLLDTNMARELEGLGFMEEERALWAGGEKVKALLSIFSRADVVKGKISTVYGLADSFTKAAIYFAQKDELGPLAARNLANMTSGEYTARPPAINFLSRGVYGGRVSPWMILFSNPFAFYKMVVEPQRIGNLLVNHPTLLIAAIAAAYYGVKAAAKRVAKQYNISEEQAAEMVTELTNYQWLNGRAVLPVNDEVGVDLTDLIPMVRFLTTFQKELVAHEDLFREVFKWGGLVFGTDSPNFVLNILASWQTGYDYSGMVRYGKAFSIGDTTWKKLVWTAQQLLPGWLNTILIKNPKNNKDISFQDIIGQYIVTATDEEKLRFYKQVRSDPSMSREEINAIYKALFKGTPLRKAGE